MFQSVKGIQKRLETLILLLEHEEISTQER
jgi:hypothetical protein